MKFHRHVLVHFRFQFPRETRFTRELSDRVFHLACKDLPEFCMTLNLSLAYNFLPQHPPELFIAILFMKTCNQLCEPD